MSQFDNVSVITTPNVYFEGLCVSYTVLFADASRKTVGVIFPSTLTFNTGAPEVMEIVGGRCRVLLPGASDWREVTAGESFEVPGQSSFQIASQDRVDYVCHFV